MSKKPLTISESAAVQMPMKTVASLIMMVAIGTWAYFGLHETLNKHSTQLELNKAIEDGMHNKVNIQFLQKQVEKAVNDIERLKDKQREFANGEKH